MAILCHHRTPLVHLLASKECLQTSDRQISSTTAWVPTGQGAFGEEDILGEADMGQEEDSMAREDPRLEDMAEGADIPVTVAVASTLVGGEATPRMPWLQDLL